MRTTDQEIELIANFYAKDGESDLLKTAITTLVTKVSKEEKPIEIEFLINELDLQFLP